MYLQLSLRTTDGVGGGKSWDYQYPLTTNWLLSPHHHHHQHLTPGYATTTTLNWSIPTTATALEFGKNIPFRQSSSANKKEHRTEKQKTMPSCSSSRTKKKEHTTAIQCCLLNISKDCKRNTKLQCLVRFGWLVLTT